MKREIFIPLLTVKTKSIFIFLFSLFVTGTNVLYSQITIGNIEKKEEKIVLKPEPYDSLKDFQSQENPLNYKQYIGLQFFLPPFSNPKITGKYPGKEHNFLFSMIPSTIKAEKVLKIDKGILYNGTRENYDRLVQPSYDCITTFIYKPFHYYFGGNGTGGQMAGIASDANEVNNTYFTVLDVFYGDKLRDLFNRVNRNQQKIDEQNCFSPGWRIEMKHDNEVASLLFLLRNDKTGDSVLCSDPSRLKLVPFFVRQKGVFQNQKIIYDGPGVKEPDLITNNSVEIKKASKWVCSDVTLLKKGQVYPKDFNWNSIDSSSYSLFYILKDDNGKTIALDNLNLGYQGKFMIEQVYLKQEKEKKLQHEEVIARQKQEERTRIAKEKQEQAQYKADCIRRFGQENGELIAHGKVKIGMTTEMCKASWGKPFWNNKTTTENEVSEDWYYGYGYSLHFVNGALTRIVE